MKNLKFQIKQFAFRVYLPLITRIERLRATRMWLDGVRQAEAMHREIRTHRVYLLYDEKHSCWAPMTWNRNRALKPAFLVLRAMGKMRASQRIHIPADLERYSFYFTRSKRFAHSAKEHNALREAKLKKWIDYYMLHLSIPMAKVREYQKKVEGYEVRSKRVSHHSQSSHFS